MESGSASPIGFVREAVGLPGVFGIFEDDGDTGYLYLYEPSGREVFQHLHIYDRTPDLAVRDQDVTVLWSQDFSKIGVLIWGKMRGIVNLTTGQESRVWLESRDTPGIVDAEWLTGFRLD